MIVCITKVLIFNSGVIMVFQPRLFSFSEPCENLDCKDTTDTCRDGTCYCGSSSSVVCDSSSQYPLCSEGLCFCSKVKRRYEIGDGTTQGSCTSNLNKCQSDGRCVECIYNSQCTGLSNKCLNGICVCGDLTVPCNSSSSNICDSNGVCKCGTNDECYTTLQTLKTGSDVSKDCDKYKCSWDKISGTCKQQRGSEVCEQITRYYNPLYLEGDIKDDTPLDFTCDDEKGKYLGTYQCLGRP